MKNMFTKCSKLESIYLYFDTINVYDMSEMFSECTALKHLNISNFQITNNTHMEKMFINCNNMLKMKIQKSKIKNKAFDFNKN